MLFFVICAAFAIFPDKVIYGAQSGLALCINSVIPSLLPFMLVSSCIIKSKFSRPMGAFFSRILSPITKMSTNGCVCFITGILGGYGAGARAVMECYSEKQISKREAENLLAFCNNAGPLFIIGTVGIGFYSSKTIGFMLLAVQIITALLCARVFSGDFKEEKKSIKEEWLFYKKNKPPFGGLVTSSAIENGSAIITASVFIITFSAIVEVLPFGEYKFLAGFLEVTRGIAEISRVSSNSLPFVSALLSWGGMSVHFQADALCFGKFDMKTYYTGKAFSSIVSFLITKLFCSDINIILLCIVFLVSSLAIFFAFKCLFFPKCILPHGFRLRRHS